MAALTAVSTSPGLDFHVPRPNIGILRPEFRRTDEADGAIVTNYQISYFVKKKVQAFTVHTLTATATVIGRPVRRLSAIMSYSHEVKPFKMAQDIKPKIKKDREIAKAYKLSHQILSLTGINFTRQTVI
ncbi:unnamed protein product, partial [Meganyctiphanes norvegica]